MMKPKGREERVACLGKGQRPRDLRWEGYSHLGTSSHGATQPAQLLQGCSATSPARS